MRKNKWKAPDGFMKSGLKLIGAKVGQTRDSGRRKIYACEPGGVKTYIEPFLGSGNVVVGKFFHEKEIVGDISPYVINFFQVMQSRPEELFPVLDYHIQQLAEKGEEHFLIARKNPPEHDELALAAWYYVLNKCSFNGIVRFNNKGECNSTYCGTTKGRGLYDKDWFDKVWYRIQKIEFNNVTYQELLKRADKDSWVVCDPPYYEVFTKYDRIDFKPEDHIEMRDCLAKTPGKWLVTLNDHPVVRELYRDFNIFGHGIFYSCSQTPEGRGVRPEVIITNYDFDTEKINTIIDRTGR